jgi:hypothetical protein
MPGDEAKKLASIAEVTDSLDEILDRLFANVAQLKQILAPPPDPHPAGGDLARLLTHIRQVFASKNCNALYHIKGGA